MLEYITTNGHDNLILGTVGPCFVCGKLTPWIEINYEGHLCSSECSEQADCDITMLMEMQERPYCDDDHQCSGCQNLNCPGHPDY